VVPAAASTGRPDLAARHGVGAFERIAADLGIDVVAEAVLVVDAASAADPAIAGRLAQAHVIHLPGGEPHLVAEILRGTPAWHAILDAHAAGAAIAGASAGAMALADRTWSRRGWLDGLGLVHGLVVVPHFAQFDARGRESDVDRVERERLNVLGLDERTGVIREAPGTWRVAGQGRAVWRAPGAEPAVGRHGDLLPIDG
jgi:cyanophycinase-like exopeptidase